jgi:hypothetical protein
MKLKYGMQPGAGTFKFSEYISKERMYAYYLFISYSWVLVADHAAHPT